MNKRDFVSLLQRQANGKTTAEEDHLIESIWEQIYLGQAPFDWKMYEEAEIKGSIKAKIDQRVLLKSKTRKLFPFKVWFRAAAVVLFLLLGGLYYFGAPIHGSAHVVMVEKHTNDQQRAKIMLPDGTMVHLNVNSTLSYPEEFEHNKRIVQLNGEAFFEVKRDTLKPFYVISNELETKVLGTSFNVNAYESNEEMITVNTGKVQVSMREDLEKKVYLLTNEAAVFPKDSNQLNKMSFNAQQAIGWTSGKLDFEMVPFDEVIRTLSNYYHREIYLENYPEGSCMIKASYENNGLHFILSGLKLLVDFEYREEEDGDLIITYQSCGKS